MASDVSAVNMIFCVNISSVPLAFNVSEFNALLFEYLSFVASYVQFSVSADRFVLSVLLTPSS